MTIRGVQIKDSWGAWLTRSLLLAGMGYMAYWMQSVDSRLGSLDLRVAVLQDRATRR